MDIQNPAPVPNFFPNADVLRAWLVDAMEALEISPSALGQYAQMGPNSLGRFVNETERDIKLGTAARVYMAVFKLAAVKGVAVRELLAAPSPIPET